MSTWEDSSVTTTDDDGRGEVKKQPRNYLLRVTARNGHHSPRTISLTRFLIFSLLNTLYTIPFSFAIYYQQPAI